MTLLKDRMHEALTESGKTQTDLAKACGVSSPSVNDWLSGKTKSLKAATAHRAAAFLGVSALWLSEGRGPKRSGDVVPAEPAMPEIDVRTLKLDALRQAVHAMAREFGVTPEDLVSGDWGEDRQKRLDLVISDSSEPPSLPTNARHWAIDGKEDRRAGERRSRGNRRAEK